MSRIDIDAVLAANEGLCDALANGEPWALKHIERLNSINRGEPEGFRREFDGNPRKWCGGACPFDEGCVTCTLPENPEVARNVRRYKNLSQEERDDLDRRDLDWVKNSQKK